MTQFTSHLDFSLTKKRLLMMGKRISKVKVGAIWLLVLPVSVASIIVFSTDSSNYDIDDILSTENYRNAVQATTTIVEKGSKQKLDDDSRFIKARNYYPAGPNPIFADTTLYLKISDIDIPPRTYYAGNGELFSGTQNWFYEQTGRLDQTIEIENGKVITSTRYNGNGDEIIKSEKYDQIKDTTYHRFYKNGVLESTSKAWFYKSGSIVYSFTKGIDTDGSSFYSEFEKNLTNNYQQSKIYKSGLLYTHMYKDDEISTNKMYYDNGLLMSESSAKNNGNENYWSGSVIKHGTQTTYLENGDLLRKEVWENGELIEKIK